MNTETAASLTFASDKFPAFSALISVMQAKTNYFYAAGLWKNDMLRDLARFSSVNDLDKAILHEHAQYIAPSWSWASTRNAARYADHPLYDDPKGETAQVLDAQLELAGPESLGQLRGHIEIRGMTAVGVMRIRPLEYTPDITNLYFFDDGEDDSGQEPNILVKFYSDDPRISVIYPDCEPGSAHAEDLFSLRRKIRILPLRTVTLTNGQLMWAATAVEPLPTLGDDCWWRVGLVGGTFDQSPPSRSLFEASRQITMKTHRSEKVRDSLLHALPPPDRRTAKLQRPTQP